MHNDCIIISPSEQNYWTNGLSVFKLFYRNEQIDLCKVCIDLFFSPMAFEMVHLSCLGHHYMLSFLIFEHSIGENSAWYFMLHLNAMCIFLLLRDLFVSFAHYSMEVRVFLLSNSVKQLYARSISSLQPYYVRNISSNFSFAL